MLQKADKIFIDMLREADLYDKVWQAGVMLLPVQSVGVMGDERTYESCVALRAVTSTDGMTADWVHLPYDFLAKVSNEIINKVNGVNRVVSDISSKPPATIEWEEPDPDNHISSPDPLAGAVFVSVCIAPISDFTTQKDLRLFGGRPSHIQDTII